MTFMALKLSLIMLGLGVLVVLQLRTLRAIQDLNSRIFGGFTVPLEQSPEVAAKVVEKVQRTRRRRDELEDLDALDR